MAEQWFKPGVPLRPQRFDLRVPVRYRAVGSSQWLIGRTDNISLTGVLIRATRMLAADARVELIFKVPSGLVPDVTGEMLFTGTVARFISARIPGQSPGIGIQFESWRPVTDTDV